MVKHTHNKRIFCTLFILCCLFSATLMANEAASQEKKDLTTTLKEFISPGSG